MRLPPRFSQGELGLNRIEAFSDGVFAIVITLLVLDLSVPTLREAHALTKEEVAARAGYEANGGGFNALSRLRTLELVQGRGELRASDNLFVAGTA